MKSFSAIIKIIDVNPYVLLPDSALESLKRKSGKVTGVIPVRGTIDGKPFLQTVVKFRGVYRLYINGVMRKATGKDSGDTIRIVLEFDPADRTVPLHPELNMAFKKNKPAFRAYNSLSPSRKKEINRYLGFLKSPEALERNIKRVIDHLKGNGPFVGRN